MPEKALLLLWFLLLAIASSQAEAWGSRGHRIIAALAEQQLDSGTKAAIASLLGPEDLIAAATWADEMRSAQDNPPFWNEFANHWHFVNLPVAGNYAESAGNPHGDAVAAYRTFSAILLDQPLPDGPVQTGLRLYFGPGDLHSLPVKRFALKFLIHIVADLHQPLHSGYASDHGGNDIKLSWHGKDTNLHALWDSQLLEHEKLSEANYCKRLQYRISHTQAADLRHMQSIDAVQWLQESSELLLRIHARQPQAAVEDSGYMDEFVPIAENQLMKAAVRTAYVLNNLFAGRPAGTR